MLDCIILFVGEYQVLCKGAESSVLKKCIAGPIDETIEHVDYYASVSTGLALNSTLFTLTSETTASTRRDQSKTNCYTMNDE